MGPVRECPALIPQIVAEIWREWSEDFETQTAYTSPALLQRFVESTVLSDAVPVVYAMRRDEELLGFCFVDTEDANVMPWLAPWLANVMVLERFRGMGYSALLLNHVVPLHTPLYLWASTKQLADLYVRFGFELLEVIPKHGAHVDLHVMVKKKRGDEK